MHTTTLRKVGGSVMLAVPPAILNALNLRAGEQIAVTIEGDRLVIGPARRRYTLAELLAQCKSPRKHTAEDRQWFDAAAVGRELL